jgi:hypothetical protein
MASALVAPCNEVGLENQDIHTVAVLRAKDIGGMDTGAASAGIDNMDRGRVAA